MSDASLLDLDGEESEAGRGWSRGGSSRRRRRLETRSQDAAADARPSVRGAVRLVALDAVSVTGGWLGGSLLFGSVLAHPDGQLRPVAALLGLVAVSLAANHAWGLYAEGVADRALEFTGCARTCLLGTAFVTFVSARLNLNVSLRSLAVSGVLSLLLLVIARSAHRARLTSLRRRDRAVRSTLVIGTNDEGHDLCRLLGDDSDFGFRPRGVVGDRQEYERHPFTVPWLGETDAAPLRAGELGVDHVFVARTAISSGAFTRLARHLTESGVNVVAAGGLPGVDQRRLKIVSIAQMPMFALNARSPSRREAFLKRGLDTTVAILALVGSLPVMAAATLGILILDGRPILFRQTRVGRHGVPFTMYKFRTMIRDADMRVIDLLDKNERQGPLFKLTRDPRVTRIGRFLRSSSIDELPQLLNVIQGTMSLVGPRPALASETERFSAELLARNGTKPGMTGLWQVEAGDDPSFALYERLDLFYVENWSLALDLAILIATIPTVVWRTFDRLARGRRQAASETAERPQSLAGAPAQVVTVPDAAETELAEIIKLAGPDEYNRAEVLVFAGTEERGGSPTPPYESTGE